MNLARLYRVETTTKEARARRARHAGTLPRLARGPWRSVRDEATNRPSASRFVAIPSYANRAAHGRVSAAFAVDVHTAAVLVVRAGWNASCS
ncbi:hypothetical protein RR48_10672 [Papilio machaon]|uniref:Uncharacterized protein n=1 Tax=Papilio machaon TaxID=76193 RepID=A0A194RLL6_PAPMA|nr:hypothetical protein RR48_10672 [Papilio machaon]